MLMKPPFSLEPLARAREFVPTDAIATFELLISAVPMPPDQPYCAQVIATAADCFIKYARTIGHVRADFDGAIADAVAIANAIHVNQRQIEGAPPSAQLKGRTGEYPVWTLLSQLTADQAPLCVAAGAELAICLLLQNQAHPHYYQQLLRDSKKYGRPTAESDRQFDDLVDIGFGRGWLAHFTRIDKLIRRAVERPDPNGPARPDHANPLHRLDLLARLRWRLDYPNPKHRQAVGDDSQLTMHQLKRAAGIVRSQVEASSSDAMVACMAMITGFSGEVVLSLPLVTKSLLLDTLGLEGELGLLNLDLDAIAPSRARPVVGTEHLFFASSDVLALPLPVFLVQEIQRRHLEFPNATHLGDLVTWRGVDPRSTLIQGETCRLKASLARASHSMAAHAIQIGVDRIMAACLTWDFSITGSARIYYTRLLGADLQHEQERLWSSLTWGPAHSNRTLSFPDCGSRCVLSDRGVQQVFSHLSESCIKIAPGKTGSLSRLLEHHLLYTRYCVCFLSFCFGLREAQDYRLLGADLSFGQALIIVRDKHRQNSLMSQPAVINVIAKEQIQHYRAHCAALIARLKRFNDRTAVSMSQALTGVVDGQGPLFLAFNSRGAPHPIGSAESWGKLPPELRVPANVGRHYWASKFHDLGLSSRDIDRFMRHRVVGLENNTSSQVSIPADSFSRIENAQVEVLNDLSISALVGLRRAAE